VLEPAERDGDDGRSREAAYLKFLVDSKAVVVVELTTGEQFRGRVRYYDRDCFSIGPIARGPNIFLRKSSVRCIIETEMGSDHEKSLPN